MGETEGLREFIGFIWPDGDFDDQTGLLLFATDVKAAAAIVHEAWGEGYRASIWNEQDAAKPR